MHVTVRGSTGLVHLMRRERKGGRKSTLVPFTRGIRIVLEGDRLKMIRIIELIPGGSSGENTQRGKVTDNKLQGGA